MRDGIPADMGALFHDDLPSSAYRSFPDGMLFTGDSIAWMSGISDASVDLVFADPPYNIGKADWDRIGSEDDYVAWSSQWISEAARILKPAGSMYICGFSETLADLKRTAMKHFASCRWLVWHYRNKANLGSDWGRSHESILHLRKNGFPGINVDDIRIPYAAHTMKYPDHAQGATSRYGRGRDGERWEPNPLGAKPRDVLEIPTTRNGMGEKTPHPTQKPEELLRTLVLASSREHDLVLDPFSGSGTTAVVASQLHRRWLACDESSEYNSWAARRLEAVDHGRSVEDWKAFDRENRERRLRRS